MKPAQIASVVTLTLACIAAAEVVISKVTPHSSTVRERIAERTPPLAAISAPPVVALPVDTTRPPVPLKVNHRAPLGPEALKPDATTESPGGGQTTEAAPPSEQVSDAEKAAKAAIEADGYRGVQILSQGGNGVWKASALRGRTRIVVNVDAAGNVFTE